MDFYVLSFFHKMANFADFFSRNIGILFRKTHEFLLFSRVRFRYVAIISFVMSIKSCFKATQMDTRKRKGEILGFKSWNSELYFDRLRGYYLDLYCSNDHVLLSWLEKCSDELRCEIERNNEDSIVLMPMHFFSDEFAILIGAKATDKRVDVLSDGSNTNWKEKWVEHLKYSDRTNINDNPISNLNLYNVFEKDNAESAKIIINLLKDLKRKKTMLAIFLDALPAYTAKFNKRQKLQNTFLFKEKAFLHKGIFSFPIISAARVIPYYIYVEKGEIKIKVFNSISSRDELYEEKIMEVLEESLKEKHQQWMLWHFPFFYNYIG